MEERRKCDDGSATTASLISYVVIYTTSCVATEKAVGSVRLCRCLLRAQAGGTHHNKMGREATWNIGRKKRRRNVRLSGSLVVTGVVVRTKNGGVISLPGTTRQRSVCVSDIFYSIFIFVYFSISRSTDFESLLMCGYLCS